MMLHRTHTHIPILIATQSFKRLHLALAELIVCCVFSTRAIPFCTGPMRFLNWERKSCPKLHCLGNSLLDAVQFRFKYATIMCMCSFVWIWSEVQVHNWNINRTYVMWCAVLYAVFWVERWLRIKSGWNFRQNVWKLNESLFSQVCSGSLIFLL